MAREPERLQRILEYQSYLEEEGKRQMRTLQASLNRARARLRSVKEAYQARATRREAGTVEQSAMLVCAQAYAERLRQDLAQQEQAVQRAEESFSRARQQLTVAAQGRVATERLLQRRLQAREERWAAEEQEELDARGRLRQVQEVD